MRAQEFITEQHELPPESKEPLRWTYELPGLSTADPYRTYRMGVAFARARSDQATDGVNDFRPEWTPETAMGKYAVVAGMNSGIEQVIDAALGMTDTPGGKRMVSSPESEEPDFVQDKSPIRPFKGYPR